MADQEPLHKRINYDKLGLDKDEEEDSKKRVSRGTDVVRPKLSEGESGEDATYIIKQLDKPEGLLSGAWLQGMSDQELVFTVIALILELQARVGKPEGQEELIGETASIGLDPTKYSFSLDRPDLKIDIEHFVRLPAPLSASQVAGGGTPWRFILISSNPKHELLRLEVHDEIVIGRSGGDITPNLDLTFHDGVAAGVSRRHAVLRPAPDGLYLIDQESTNGTFHNRERLTPGKAQKLEDQDIVSFSNLHFKIMFVSRPGD